LSIGVGNEICYNMARRVHLYAGQRWRTTRLSAC